MSKKNGVPLFYCADYTNGGFPPYCNKQCLECRGIIEQSSRNFARRIESNKSKKKSK